MGLNLDLLKDNKSGDPTFFPSIFFLKCQIMVHEIKTKNKFFLCQFFKYIFCSKNRNLLFFGGGGGITK